MIKNISTYEEWKNLGREEKASIENEIWAIDFRKGRGIRNALLSTFKKKYAQKKGVLSVEFRYCKYILGIFVVIKKGYKIRLPRKFDIFFVEKEYV